MSAALPADLARHALREPQALPGLPLATWDLLLRQARRANVVARIGSRLEALGLLDEVPAAPRSHLRAAAVVVEAQHDEVRREVGHLGRLFRSMSLPLVLLKGAAYVMSGRAAAQGRLFSDIDVLVPRARLTEVESALMSSGWTATHHSAYDQRYYREWMHELPPLRHATRGTTLDVHHAILPLTARLKPDSTALLGAIEPVAGTEGLHTLAPTDMLLHSMTHLFHNEEMTHGLRDLSDLDLLLREFGTQPRFWQQLTSRARLLDLERPLFYGLRHAHRLLDTPVPDSALQETAGAAPPALRLMDALWQRGLGSHHATAKAPLTGAALFCLYVRAHWLRMPPVMLTRHLLTKAWMRTTTADEPA